VRWSSRFALRRDPSYVGQRTTDQGSIFELLETFNADRRLSEGLVVDLPGALRAATQPADPGGPPALLARIGLAVVSPIKPLELSWTDEVGARFERDRADPGLAFQLGAAPVAELRRLGDDTAAVALHRNAFRARSGLRIGRASLDVSYAESDLWVDDLRVGARSQRERSWPSVQLSLDRAPLPELLAGVLDRWSVSTGYIRTRRATRLAGQLVRVRGQRENTIPLEMRLGFAVGVSLAYVGAFTEGNGTDPTGYTDQESLSHSVDVSGRVRLPGALGERFPAPVRISLTYDYEQERQTRVASALEGAVPPTPFIDYLNRRLYLSASTLMQRMDIGVRLSYVDRRNFIGAQIGSSQLQLGVFGQFNMATGRELGR
jgi:hypothetical protein